jgi:hypothetical protein
VWGLEQKSRFGETLDSKTSISKDQLEERPDTIAMGILVDDPWEARMGHTGAENLFLSS